MAEGSLRLSSEGMRVVADAASGLDREALPAVLRRTLNTTRLPVLVPDSLLVGVLADWVRLIRLGRLSRLRDLLVAGSTSAAAGDGGIEAGGGTGGKIADPDHSSSPSLALCRWRDLLLIVGSTSAAAGDGGTEAGGGAIGERNHPKNPPSLGCLESTTASELPRVAGCSPAMCKRGPSLPDAMASRACNASETCGMKASSDSTADSVLIRLCSLRPADATS